MTKQYLNPVESGAATVIARKESKRKGQHIVLAFLGIEHPTPYVTWLEYVPDRATNKVVYETGHYFYGGDIASAVADYEKRI